jgi:hypothetical protein
MCCLLIFYCILWTHLYFGILLIFIYECSRMSVYKYFCYSDKYLDVPCISSLHVNCSVFLFLFITLSCLSSYFNLKRI